MHWVGCLWYLLVKDGRVGYWLPPRQMDSGITDFYDVGLWSKYSVVFYYAMLLLVGNEVAPVNTPQTVYSSAIVIIGSITMAFIFGNMAALMAELNSKENAFHD